MALQLPAPNPNIVILPSRFIGLGPCAHSKGIANPTSLPLLASTYKQKQKHGVPRIKGPTLEEIPPNALRRKRDPIWRGGFSLGVDLGMSRTGLALSKGFSIRPLTVTSSPHSLPLSLIR